MTQLKNKAINQLRHAANNLFLDSQDHAATDEHRGVSRAARLLVEQLANALESGATYKTSGRAEEFDHVNEVREAQLHVNPN